MNHDNNLSRRGFLQASAAWAAALPVSRMATGQQTQPASAMMPKRRLGKTGLQVPILQMGGSFNLAPVLFRRALELGVNFVDTAASYMGRRAEGILGKTLGKLAKREDYMIITKGHPKKPEDIYERCLPRSLAQLQSDYVDGWFFHGLDDPSILTSPEWKAAAEKAKKSGKTRFFGFSCHGKNVVELLKTSAKVGFVDVIMLKYNFRSYGDAELNRAIDAAYKADVGLIAMKTQGAAVSLAERMNPFEQAGYNKHQAVLKAVWRDPRMASCCSEMPSLKILEENVAAATQPLTTREARLVRDWAERTARLYCPGGSGICRRQCEAALDQPAAIADTLRCLMYHDSYGRQGDARELFAQLPDSLRPSLDIDLAAAERACPLRLPVAKLVRDALGRLRCDSAAAAEGLCV